MYNKLLKVFTTAVDTGSFTKAADKLYLTPTAVMKKINALEDELALKLLIRTHSGIIMTAAGEVIYRNAQFLFAYSEKSIEEARSAADNTGICFRVGSSILNPVSAFMNIWYQLADLFPESSIHIVPFQDTNSEILSEIAALGTRYDFIVGICDSNMWRDRADFIQLGSFRKMIAVSRNHPLAQKEKLKLSDMKGYTLMMVKEGDSPLNDVLRHDLISNCPDITIEDTPHFYDLSVFNRCAESNKLLLSTEFWKDVHPGLKTIPVEWEYEIPYGLLCPKSPSAKDLKFINAVKALLKKQTLQH